jgi:hypothetical protein
MSAPVSMRQSAREWLAYHLHAFVWILIALWAPPVIFTVLVDLKLVDSPGSGYLALRDPSLLLSIMLIVSMAAALPMMRLRRARAWQLLCGSLGLWWAHAAWTVQARLRLIGPSDLVSRETVVTLAALAIATYVVFEVRGRFTRAGALTPRPTTSQQPAALRPDRM